MCAKNIRTKFVTKNKRRLGNECDSRDSPLFIQIICQNHYIILYEYLSITITGLAEFLEINELTIDAFIVTSLNALDWLVS